MKSVLISIQPKWCELIANGKKTIEVRKTRPKLETPFKCYIYQTKKSWIYRLLKKLGLYQGKVIGEFVCDRIATLKSNTDGSGNWWHEWSDESVDYEDMCLSEREIEDYLGLSNGYGWHISALKIYDKPKELGELWAYNSELNKRYTEQDGYCCYDGTNEHGEALTDCGDAGDNIKNCYRCWEEWSGWCHKVKRPPQSWCYVEG